MFGAILAHKQIQFHSLPVNIILNHSKFKALIYMLKLTFYCLEKQQSWLPAYFSFPTMFSKAFMLGSLCGKELISRVQ